MDGGRVMLACRSVSDRIRPYFFPFGFLPPQAMGYKAKGKWEALRHGPAVEDTDGRSVSDRTRPRFFSLAFAPPDPPTGVPASGIGYGFYHV